MAEGKSAADPRPMRRRAAKWLHFRRFLAHPARLAAVFSSSDKLSRLVAEQVRPVDDGIVVELGAGTGAVTRALLSAGVPGEKLIAVELDAQMAQFLRSTHPNVTVVEGCALGLRQLLPPSAIGRIGSVVCGIPASLMPIERQRELVSVMLSLVPAGRPFHMYSYRLSSPLPARTLDLVGKRLAFTLRNFPPASVWAYRADGRGREQAVAGRSEADPET
jgi:phosphatidylethanolamine/phosphatidyl-N-methylethanolamine N-methyltransferase